MEQSQTNNRKKRVPPKAWKPGQSGNPNGRPKKGHSITETIKEMMEKDPEIKAKLARKILLLATAGDTTAIKTLWGYMDGMPHQTTDITSDGKAIQNEQIAALTGIINSFSQDVRRKHTQRRKEAP